MSLQLATIEKQGSFVKKDYGRLSDGPHLARIVSVIDLGEQEQTDYKTGDATDPKKKVMITFETPDERINIENDEGTVSRPRWLGKEYTISMHEKSALFKLIQSICPDANALDELLNIACMITVGSTSGDRAKVVGVSLPMKGAEVGDLENDAVYFDFDDPDLEQFSKMPRWIRDKIKSALNYNGFADDLED